MSVEAKRVELFFFSHSIFVSFTDFSTVPVWNVF